MSRAEARAWLDSHVNLETGVGFPPDRSRRSGAPTLERIRALVELLGSPQESYPCVHVTGTNGKTSVARMTAELLASSGLSVGVFTSPHLQSVCERLAWNGEPVPDDELDRLLEVVELVEPHLPEPPTYFEIMTAAALTWFADVAVDCAVVEVGMGGEWDATNVVDGRVAVVTNVSLDHVEYLGPTRADIAREKAGIVKPASTLVLGETDGDLRAIFLGRERAAVCERGPDFGVRAQRLAHGGRLLDLHTPTGEMEGVFLPLHGAHQGDNAAAALAAAEAFLGRGLAAEVAGTAFARVRSPGRLEVVGHQPLVLLDGAHNVAGAHALLTAVREEFATAHRVLVVGLLRGKEPHEMLEALGVPEVGGLVCCAPPSPRALEPSAVAAAAVDLGLDADRITVVDDVAVAVDRAVASSPADGEVLVTGSLYVVGAAREALLGSGARA